MMTEQAGEGGVFERVSYDQRITMHPMHLTVPFSLLWMRRVFERISCVCPWVFQCKSIRAFENLDIPTGPGAHD